ncbi:fimbria/pilus outer membrane usher protein [Serratia marcescens]|uniref:fimbria/pilus outer membrane usher protein n=3 Tax=Serratia marcescens TaxID=615 RepID=UPI00215503EC|nr:fimbria/pilus outer membrane usher protein [Serratia marcescens]MDT0205983.1 fimbria/pilus outer membrane usher protein [Serratia marcescens]MDV5745020.1 fimbria/pilus outer membrane usher protein [Serratia marcescens]MDV5749931.1 fimbria/pilus outer membrane usher protein [Serratia marcescens]MDV5781369.1 fimbria/pilus outer membrane usher protein [Serratia marcescens]MDV5786311.1 fimbria/pilus outer membrane usher protein [Serratia marcescens]
MSIRQSASALLFLLVWPMTKTAASGFDVKTLAQLGYNADIAAFFNTARFLPGVHRVMLEVNAAQRYQEEVRFDSEGELCLDERLAQTLRLRVASPPGRCERLETYWPQAVVRVFPGAFRVEITLPEVAFDPDKLRTEQSGGHALLLNYDLYANRRQGRYGNQQTLQAMLEPGINLSNWVLRNRSSYSNDENGSRLEVYETSASKDFPGWGAFVQLGEFSAGGVLSGNVPLSGGQLASVDIGGHNAALTVPLQGSVVNPATLEVKQHGQLIFRTLLPAGPFSLSELGPVMAGVEAEVTVIETDGRRQRFTVTPDTGDPADRSGGYRLAAGRYQPYGGDHYGTSPPALLLGEKAFRLGQGQITVGGLLAHTYKRLGWQGSLGDDGGNWLSGSAIFTRGRQPGAQLETQGQVAMGRSLALSLSSQYRTEGFREADEGLLNPSSVEAETARLRYSGGLALSWRALNAGVLAYSLSHERYYRGSRRSWTHALAYGASLGRATLSVNLQSSAYDRAAVYAGLSLPWGAGSVSSRLQARRNKQMTLGGSWQGPLSERLNGYLDVTRDADGDYQSAGNLNGETPYTRLGLGASRSGQGSTSLSLSSSGGLGVANGTWVTSPQRIGDTFAVMKVPGQSGVKISGSGNGVTDFAGDALLPVLMPYMPLRAQVDTLSLPLNLRLDSTDAALELARGTVAERRFRVTEVRQLLLTLRDESGAPLPTGASVYDEQGQLLGTLIGEGNLMLVNDDIGKALRVRRLNMNECVVSYAVPAAFDPSVLYEEGDGVCRAAGGSSDNG